MAAGRLLLGDLYSICSWSYLYLHKLSPREPQELADKHAVFGLLHSVSVSEENESKLNNIAGMWVDI